MRKRLFLKAKHNWHTRLTAFVHIPCLQQNHCTLSLQQHGLLVAAVTKTNEDTYYSLKIMYMMNTALHKISIDLQLYMFKCAYRRTGIRKDLKHM